MEVGVIRGTSVGEAAGGCATRNRKFSCENLFARLTTIKCNVV